ncbi:hypothetical protein A3F29_01415 [Candidatus Roizmanbacteria bacterium RIFCSPHIGHO2_12_FULL_33_9]|uniref:Antitoxin n=1 Tax=Candidatus Roizmanbacteria bacterium RIFCSPHIGHO2_12_FULL_33_9 TaxID=1802045 RepID=A0A1F7HLF1_9BACT|nr:MAG: hypothetical protein A3F29_01415 [Candidatus Roizmanbacteria bacterium RIFCSPHIGHO2_12_FULL_33_9]
MLKTISITEARKNIFKISDDIKKTGSHYVLTDKGRSKVVIMSAEEYDSWAETLEVMKDFPNIEKDIKETESDYKSGNYTKYPTLGELLHKEGYMIADKGKVKYEISTKTKTKRKKRA